MGNFYIVGTGVLAPLFYEDPRILPTPSFQILLNSWHIMCFFYWYSNLIPHTQIYKAHSGASRLTDPYKYMFAPTVMCPQQLPLLY